MTGRNQAANSLGHLGPHQPPGGAPPGGGPPPSPNPSKPKTDGHGGMYGRLRPAGAGKEIHHIPPKSVNKVGKYSGPAVRMDKDDHRALYSTGSSLESQAWRMWQQERIDAGDYRGAMQMEIDDIRSRFGDKYDGEINEMLDSLGDNQAMLDNNLP